ncbi:ATP-binding protein, partial [Polymorphospora sp. NPDC050346]|uniref:ATP-binding protein n=1 Tax=Polymorphospora sp. NPDC050346 TaxID=3155780 RepID=UPI0033E99084
MGYFLGIGVGSYAEHPSLGSAVEDVEALSALLGGGFKCQVVADPDEVTARKRLQALENVLPGGGALVLLWCGHGVGSSTSLQLLASDSGSSEAAGIGMDDVARCVAVSGASQLLLVLDTCFSGQALSATAVVAKVLERRPPDSPYVWVGVLSSCQDLETAQDGLLGQRLRKLIDEGPRTALMRVRWSVHNEFIRGDDLCDAVLKEWDSDRQSPQFQGRGSAWWMIRNPLFDPGAPERVVEHLLLAARGGQQIDERSWFTGRTVEVNQVVGWVRSGKPGVYVVTGSAGTGKSAIVGRVVSLSNPAERQRLLDNADLWGHDDPGERSIHAHLHARGLTTDRAAEVVAAQLIRCRVLVAQAERHNAQELVGHVRRVVEAGTPPPVIVVDGLDEARGEAFDLAGELLVRLARYAVVVVSTRDVPGPGHRPDLVAGLAPVAALDLDASEPHGRLSGDLFAYVRTRLIGVDPAMEPDLVANHLTSGAALASTPFLLARLVTDQLRAAPVDTSAHGWQVRVAGSIEMAFDTDLAAVETPVGRPLPEKMPAAEVARLMLVALTRGYGAGLPEAEWLAAANATRTARVRFERDDVSWVLNELGRYVVQDGEVGVAVYRLAHQSLADYIRQPYRANHETPFDPAASAVAAALIQQYRTLLISGVQAEVPGYLSRYLWRHAADAGPSGLTLLRELADVDRALRLDVALAALTVADHLGQWGYRHEAVAPTEDAVETFRMLASTNAAFLP